MPAATSSPGFTLVEVLVTVAALVIILGLMANLARSVRRQASDRQTKSILATLTHLMDRYLARNGGELPAVAPLVAPATEPAEGGDDAPADGGPADPEQPADLLEEAALRQAARANNRDFVRILRKEAGPAISIFGLARGAADQDVLFDAWGTEIVFMPSGHPAFGTALQDRPYFFSAGPDGRFRTLEDNVYSYEALTAGAEGVE